MFQHVLQVPINDRKNASMSVTLLQTKKTCCFQSLSPLEQHIENIVQLYHLYVSSSRPQKFVSVLHTLHELNDEAVCVQFFHQP